MSTVIEYSRGADWYNTISRSISEPMDYFDFPSSMIAFGESLGSSHLMSVDNKAFFRERNKQLVLVSYTCEPIELMEIIVELKAGGQEIRTLNFANKPMDGFKRQSYGNEYYTTGWCAEMAYEKLISSHDKWKLKRAITKGEKTYYLDLDLDPAEVMTVFNAWAEAAKSRHFMVVKGHYIRYIERYYQYPHNVTILGFRRQDTNQLWGYCGFELYKGMGQITLAKHCIGDNHFPLYFWSTAIQYIMNQGCSKLFCGSTADKLKQHLCLDYTQSYKLVMK